MRQWTALAPYNAGHVMRVSGVADVEKWRAALNEVLATLGIEERAVIQVTTLALDTKIQQELNLSFAPEAVPLRAFVLVDHLDSYLFGVIYDHWFADSPSLRALMQRVFVGYGDLAVTLPPLRVASYRDTFQGLGLVRQFRALSFSVRSYLRHRRAHRIHLRDPLDFGTGFFFSPFPDGAIDRIRVFAREHGATVNDVFIATAAQVMGKFTAKQRKSKRDRVAIATAVDLRPFCHENLDDVFGFYVGYFIVVHDRPEMRSLPELVAATTRETSASKNAARALQFIWSLRITRWFWDRSPRAQDKAQLFQKGLPLLAGISNVNLTGSWADKEKETLPDRATVLDYFRISPVGPLLPLLFTLTTIRDRLSMCVTYRTTAFSQEQAKRIATDLMERLRCPKEGACE